MSVDGREISSIGAGLVCLVGLHETDTEADAEWLVAKILGARLFEDDAGRPWKQSAASASRDILLVSQVRVCVCKKAGAGARIARAADAAGSKRVTATDRRDPRNV